MKRTLSALASLTLMSVHAKLAVISPLRRSTSSKFTLVSTWAHSKLPSRPRIWSRKELHTFWTPHAKSTQREVNISNIWMCQFRTKLEKTLLNTSELQADSSTRESRTAPSLSSQFKERVGHQLSSLRTWSTRRKWSLRTVLRSSGNTLTRSNQMNPSCNSWQTTI